MQSFTLITGPRRAIFGNNTRSDKDVVVPEGVACLSHDAFQGCTGLTHMTLPKSHPCLGRDDFNGCTSPVPLKLPDGLRRMKEGRLRTASA